MAQTKLITANSYNNNNTVMLGAGNVPTNGPAASLTLSNAHKSVAKHDTLPSSGVTLGTIKSIPARQFNKQTDGEYVGMIVCDTVAGVANTTLRGGSSDVSQDSRSYFKQYNRIDISIDTETGVVTDGANNGAVVLASGLDNVTGRNADHVMSVGGEFTYMVKGVSATNADYSV